ncbi:MAG: ABC transporter ATP-binding protein [Treponema sp.]|jgi:energy-coupling factor transport system ATP-binding protein|nr:ABC transporter ATP-binding protein [Treponema sp.]
MNSPALVFENFTFKYRAQTEPTLIDINLRVMRGEKILILGPSGSGKSTLIHCINGIIPHAMKGESKGSLTILEKDIQSLTIFEISKMAGTVLQDTDGQFVGLSSAEDIAFALENDCVQSGEMHERVSRTAALVDMGSHLAKSPHDLSGGQKQRISMAGVLVDDVEILLFDEPLANLDPNAGKDAIELIDELKKKTGKTILIVEHRLEDAIHRPVDRIVVMDKGRIVADTKPSELLASGLLKTIGIREPLYLSALRYSGITISKEISPELPGALKIDFQPLKKWDGQLSAVDPMLIDNSEVNGEEPTPCIVVRNIRFRYTDQSVYALNDVSFSVAPGECVGLVGKNGSGKSTMAKCICGFVQPDSGTISHNGKDLAPLSIMERAERIGYVMQNPNQMISFPMIFDEIAFGLRNRGIAETEIKTKVYDVLKTCGLYPFRNWPVNALSYGQKKRLTIASILVLEPSLMILDEPTAGQDYRHYTEFMEFLMALSQDRISLILITHDMHLMLEYTTRAVVLSEGLCVADDEPSQILSDDVIIEKASLKRTSLYNLALNANLPDPRAFVKRYIYFDRKNRGRV